MVTKITPDEHHLWIIFHQVLDLLVKLEDSVFAHTSLSREKFNVLMVIKFFKEMANDELIITNLAPLLNRSTNSISTIIDRMEKEGLVEKVRDRSDRRSIRLVMTSEAEKRLKMAAKPNMELINKLFSVFNEEELKTLLSLIGRLKYKVDKELGQREVKVDAELSNYQKMMDFLLKM